jgi:hypothetical protein
MPVTATTEQSVQLDVGDVWYLGVSVTDDDGDALAATVSVTVTTPSGATSTPTVTAEDETGYYTATYTVSAAGRYLATMTVSGDAVGVAPFTAWADSPVAASGMPTLAQVKTYLGSTSFTDGEITDAMSAEFAAQRARCRITPVYTDDLAQALKRRVARNLAARAIPVASFTSFDGGVSSTRVPMLDAEIVRFEAPYRRLKVG